MTGGFGIALLSFDVIRILKVGNFPKSLPILHLNYLLSSIQGLLFTVSKTLSRHNFRGYVNWSSKFKKGPKENHKPFERQNKAFFRISLTNRRTTWNEFDTSRGHRSLSSKFGYDVLSVRMKSGDGECIPYMQAGLNKFTANSSSCTRLKINLTNPGHFGQMRSINFRSLYVSIIKYKPVLESAKLQVSVTCEIQSHWFLWWLDRFAPSPSSLLSKWFLL